MVFPGQRSKRFQPRRKKQKPRPQPVPVAKPIRTPLHPLRVMFVCMEGASSGANAKRFSEELQKSGIRSVIAANSYIATKVLPKSGAVKWRSHIAIRRELANADIIVYAFSPSSLAFRHLAKNVPRKAFLLSYAQAAVFSQHYTALQQFIRSHFRLQETP